jgi:NAD(P)-dependent dehydrogenase (short-subunit alcohol dehydrogenase family)
VGGFSELSIIAQSAAVPPKIVDEAADWLVNGVSEAGGILSEIADDHPGALQAICEALRQEYSEQTRRMAMTILANALVFHENLAHGAGELSEVRSTAEVRDKNGRMSKPAMLEEWRKILEINYWPIFEIARQILEVIPPKTASEILECLADTANKLLQNNVARSHDLAGAVFKSSSPIENF